MSANPNYRSIIANGGFKAACDFAHRAVRSTGPFQLAALQIQRRTQLAGYQKFVKLMEDSKAAGSSRASKQRADIDIYKNMGPSAVDEAEEAAAAAELQRALQARLDAENDTQVEMLRKERVRRSEANKRKQRQQFELEFRKFDRDGRCAPCCCRRAVFVVRVLAVRPRPRRWSPSPSSSLSLPSPCPHAGPVLVLVLDLFLSSWCGSSLSLPPCHHTNPPAAASTQWSCR
jgi:hypothetical protein